MWWWSDPLDKKLYRWSKQDALKVRHLIEGGIHAFGRTGSGKTSSLIHIARAIMRYGNSSMLILCSKRGEYRDWMKLARQCGRRRDVLLFDPSQKWRFNLVGYEAARKGEGAGIAQNVARYLMSLRNIVFREDAQAGGDSKQWQTLDEHLITKTILMLQFAGQEITAPNIHEFIATAPVNAAQLASESWRADYCNRCLMAAFGRRKNATEQTDYDIAAKFFTKTWPETNDKTRSSIQTGTEGILFPMTLGVIRELLSTKCNFTPKQAIEKRWIVIVNMPPDEWGDAGIIAGNGIKLHWSKDVLRRSIHRNSPLTCIWGDESSLWVNEFDAQYLSRCRSYRGCMVYLCQSLNSYREVLPASKADAVIKAMMDNFSHKLFFAIGDSDTAEWASTLCGKELRQFTGGGVQHAAYDPMAFVQQPGGASSSFHEQYAEVIQPGEFMNGLRTGSKANRCKVDAILIRSGVPFSNGLPLLDVTFDQRK